MLVCVLFGLKGFCYLQSEVKFADLCIQLQNLLTAHQILWLALPVTDSLKEDLCRQLSNLEEHSDHILRLPFAVCISDLTPLEGTLP